MTVERPNERPWVDHALSHLAAGEAVALISVLEVKGSTPREAGTRMVVTANEAFGTIGGGNLEFRSLEQAHRCLEHPPGTWRIQDYPLGPLMNQCCGGHVRVMIERLDVGDTDWLRALQNGDEVTLITDLTEARPVRTLSTQSLPALASTKTPPAAGDRLIETFTRATDPLMIFGAGHVGQALMHVLKGLPYSKGWYDNREEYRALLGVELMDEDGLIEKARTATGQVLIMTHDHALDYRLLVAALSSEASFIGMIGSATKRARFLSRLGGDGLADSQRARLTCPIGVPGIAGKAPEIIAVSVAAQLLLNRSAAAQIEKPVTLVSCAC
jgi:xanthine dehydrogenase accessory factor